MPLDDESLRELDTKLRDGLRTLRMEWVVEEVDSEIRAGRTVQRVPEKRQRAPYISLRSDLATGNRPTITSLPYSGPERVGLLLDAIERVVTQTYEMSVTLADFAKSAAEQYEIESPVVLFFQDDESVTAPTFRVERWSEERTRAQDQLLAKLDEAKRLLSE